MEWAIWNVLHISMEDANYYTTRLRSSQNSKMLPAHRSCLSARKGNTATAAENVYYRHMYPFCFPSIDSAVCAMANEKIVLCRKKVVAANSQLSILNSESKKLNKSNMRLMNDYCILIRLLRKPIILRKSIWDVSSV